MYYHFLHWIKTTPPLLKPTTIITAKLPQPNHIAIDDETYTHNSRLGFLYQHLCKKLINQSDSHVLLADEIQLNDQHKTIGAIDFILHNKEADQLEHWEVAIKFYLLYNDKWYGPNAQDRLDKKLNHMLTHQLQMSRNTLFTQQYPQWSECQPKLLLQGRLYTNPFIDQTTPTHCLNFLLNHEQINGYWCFAHQAKQIQEPLYELPKSQWAALSTALTQLPPINISQIHRFVHAITESGQHWFIVHDQWPNDAL